MNTLRRSTFRWNKAAITTGAVALVLFGLAFGFASAFREPPPGPSGGGSERPSFLGAFQAAKPDGMGRELPPFLEVFNARNEVPLIAQDVSFPGTVGRVRARWVRPDKRQRLPAVLLVHDEKERAAWVTSNADLLAGIGYAVLTVDAHPRRLAASRAATASGPFTDEATLAELTAAVRWLRSRPEVVPNRVGVMGLGWSGGQALALAAALPVQACVCCDAPLPNEPDLLRGLRETPLLAVLGGKDAAAGKALPAFRKALAAAGVPCTFHVAAGARAGFLGPPGGKTYAHEAAEEAWVAIYEFLEKHVEDAGPPAPAAAKQAEPVATIADLMKAVNAPTGLRGTLIRALEQKPATRQDWSRIRANAALVAEAGGWLEQRIPPRGRPEHWKEQSRAFTSAARAIVGAADRRDYPAARRGLRQLAARCAACHEEHR